MIEVMIFDLDGTLVKTERLKAISYARAAVELCPRTISEAEAVEAFGDLVGLSRQEVAQGLVDRFGLEPVARSRMPEFQVDTPWQAFVQVRLRFYDEMLADPDLLRDNQWPYAVELLRQARALGCKTALATMSGCQHAQHVLDALGLSDAFDLVMTRDDVEHGKPDPEIYQVIARELGVSVTECLVIEDSPAGVKAALAAGMPVIAVATPFTQAHLHESGLVAENRIVDDPAHLLECVRDVFMQYAAEEGSSITKASTT